MNRIAFTLSLVSLLGAAPLPARAAVEVTRKGDENPMAVIAKSTAWGMLTGVLVGTAVGLAANTDSDGPLRWGIVLGTFGGLGVGIYHVEHRPQPAALLELGGRGRTGGGLAAVDASPGRVQVRAVSVRF